MSFEGSDTSSSSALYSTPREFEKEFANTTGTSTSNIDTGIDFGVTLVNPSLGNESSSLDYYNRNNDPNQNSNEMQGYHHMVEERNWAVVGVLIALIILLWLILGGMLCYPIMRFVKRRLPVSKRRINRRYETIEGWLITKVVRPHDEGCEQIQRKGEPPHHHHLQHQTTSSTLSTTTTTDVENPPITTTTTTTTPSSASIPPTPPTMKHNQSYDTADTSSAGDHDEDSSSSSSTTSFDDNMIKIEHDEDDRDCPICMESFVIGDIVSWSSYEKCSHVYHHQCIKEWLLRHNNCPFCREIFLPVDRANTKITMKVFRELSDLRARRAERTYYCLQDGLVTLDDQHSSRKGTKTLPNTSAPTSMVLRKCGHIKGNIAKNIPIDIKEKIKPGVTKAELRKLRGDRAESICMGNGPLVEENHLLHQDNLLPIIADQTLDMDEEDIEAQLQPTETMESSHDHIRPLETTMEQNDSLTIESSEDDEQEGDLDLEGQQDSLLDDTSLACDETDSVVEAGFAKGGFRCATGLVFEEAFACSAEQCGEKSVAEDIASTEHENHIKTPCPSANAIALEKDEGSQVEDPIEMEFNDSDASSSTSINEDIEDVERRSEDLEAEPGTAARGVRPHLRTEAIIIAESE